MLIPKNLPKYSPETAVDYHHKIFSHISHVLDPNQEFKWKLFKEGSNVGINRDGEIQMSVGWMERMAHHKSVTDCRAGHDFSDVDAELPAFCENVAATCAHEMAHGRLKHIKSDWNSSLSTGFIVGGSMGLATISFIALDGLRNQPLFKITRAKRVKTTWILFVAMATLVLIGLHFRSKHMKRLRDDEHEADVAGMKILKDIGIKPEAMTNMLRTVYLTDKMHSDSIDPSSWGYKLNRTHPTPKQRYDYCMKMFSSV